VSEPYSDEELAEYLARVERYGEVMRIDGADKLHATFARLQRERDAAIADARFLADCARKLNDGDDLVGSAVEVGITALRSRLDALFDARQLEQVVARYPEVPHD
jgi:hypothetical protein